MVNKDFPIMGIDIKESDSKGYFHYSIQFRDLGLCVISPQKDSLELTERQIKSDYQSAVNRCRTNDLQTVVCREYDRANRLRMEIQQKADSFFYDQLFGGRWFDARDFAIASPFEAYAGSSGSYIVDTDYWKIKGDDAVYTCFIGFNDSQRNIVPYAIEEIAKELFRNAKVSRFSDGCYINIPINRVH